MFGIFSALVGALSVGQLVKEKTEKVIPAEYWRNTELMNMDKLNLTPEQVMKNLECGKYYLPDYPIGFDMKYEKEYEEDKQIHGFLYAYNKAARGEYKERKLLSQEEKRKLTYDEYVAYLVSCNR